MEQIGRVILKTDKYITIQVMRKTACGGNCLSCDGCTARPITIKCRIDDKQPVNIGDTLTLYMSNKTFLKNSFLCYGLSTAITLICCVTASVIFKNNLASVIGALFGFAVAYIVMLILNQLKARDKNLKYRVDRR